MCVKQKLVVVGGGFAGIYLVKHIDRRLYDVVLIDSNNYHSFSTPILSDCIGGPRPGKHSFPVPQRDAQTQTSARIPFWRSKKHRYGQKDCHNPIRDYII